VPQARLTGYQPRALPAGAWPLEDICALRETPKVAKDHTISLAGRSYTLPREPNLVAFTVELRIRPGEAVRVWQDDTLIVELPYGEPTPRTRSRSTRCWSGSCHGSRPRAPSGAEPRGRWL
jgi:hypothetical protein